MSTTAATATTASSAKKSLASSSKWKPTSSSSLSETYENGATCTNGVNSYTCSCMLCYSGINCSPDPCANGATHDDAER